MQASVLIADSIATNRVALKVKLASAWYDVDTVATGADAVARAAELHPSLIIVNETLPDMDVAGVIAQLKARMGESAAPVLALTANAVSREVLLRAGAEDVLALPVDGPLLIARIRSVLRNSASESEWRLREGTTRALGFAEPRQDFDGPVRVLQLTATGSDPHAFRKDPGIQLDVEPIAIAMRNIDKTSTSSVIVIDLPERNPEAALSLLSDLRANAPTRHRAILVAAPDGRSDLAARALDLGADDATVGALPGSEFSFRIKRLHARREINENLRAVIRSGAEAAIRDPLTRLYNRRYALPHLDRVAEQAAAADRPYAVMLADLDHFKAINDRYGHEVGDAVLIECARRLQRNIRSVDLVARIGGEEFLLVLPNTGRAAARQAALRLCRKISDRPIKLPGYETGINVTISIGLALSSTGHTGPALHYGNTPRDLLARADRALYRAKEMGRNRYMLERTAAA